MASRSRTLPGLTINLCIYLVLICIFFFDDSSDVFFLQAEARSHERHVWSCCWCAQQHLWRLWKCADRRWPLLRPFPLVSSGWQVNTEPCFSCESSAWTLQEGIILNSFKGQQQQQQQWDNRCPVCFSIKDNGRLLAASATSSACEFLMGTSSQLHYSVSVIILLSLCPSNYH